MSLIVEPSNGTMTKIVASLGHHYFYPSFEVISSLLQAGMSVARFDFRWSDAKHYKGTLDSFRSAVKSTEKPCALMLDITGPELVALNGTGQSISLVENDYVFLTPNQDIDASSNFLPINFDGLSKAVKPGDTIALCQYMIAGSDPVWLEVSSVIGDDVRCVIKNTATFSGSSITLHVLGVRIDLPILSSIDKKVIRTWGVENKIDFLSLPYTRSAQDIREVRQYLGDDLSHTQIFAKIENIEGVSHFDEILQEADGIILSCGNLSINCPPEQAFVFLKAALYKCNMAAKPAVVSHVVDSLIYPRRRTRALEIDVANAVLDGSHAILLGVEILLGLYPIQAISTVRKICAEAEKDFNQDLYLERIAKYVAQPMSNLESVASSTVRTAIEVKASVIICFTSSGRAARLIAKYMPTMPVLTVVLPGLETNQLKQSFELRQLLIVRGVFPMLADPGLPAESTNETNESILKVALDYGKSAGVVKSHDKVVVCQEAGDASVVKVIELKD